MAFASELIVSACACRRPCLLVWVETFACPWLTCSESTGFLSAFRWLRNWILKVYSTRRTWCLNLFCPQMTPVLSPRFVAFHSWSVSHLPLLDYATWYSESFQHRTLNCEALLVYWISRLSCTQATPKTSVWRVSDHSVLLLLTSV